MRTNVCNKLIDMLNELKLGDKNKINKLNYVITALEIEVEKHKLANMAIKSGQEKARANGQKFGRQKNDYIARCIIRKDDEKEVKNG